MFVTTTFGELTLCRVLGGYLANKNTDFAQSLCRLEMMGT